MAADYQRWEFEVALRDIETHQLDRRRVLRSRSPELGRQEIEDQLSARKRTAEITSGHPPTDPTPSPR